MNIREYLSEDKEAVLTLLDLNTPKFFDESERLELQNYLQLEVEDYFVVEEDSEIIGAGGINYFPNIKTARIAWDIINPGFQGKGVGGKLVEHRIKLLNSNRKIDLIVVRTSQLAYKFYEKMKFKLVTVENDYWAEGFDLYKMEMKNEI